MTTVSPGYAGFAYQDDGSAEAARGAITIDRWRLHFESEAVVIEIPLPALEIEMGGPTDGRVYFRNSSEGGWTIYTFDERVLKDRCLADHANTRIKIRQIRSSGELKRRLKVTGWFLGGFFALALGSWVVLGLLVRYLVASIPDSFEKEFGDTVLAEVKQEEVFSSDPKLKARVERAVAPLISALPKKGMTNYTFYVLEDMDPNAFAIPGGHVFITTGLLELAERPEQITGVVAHEIAHVTERHGFRRILSAAGPYLIIRIFAGDRGGMAGVLGQSSELMIRQSFSQEYEFEADAVGWDYLVAARIDPRGLPEMLRRLQEAEKGHNIGIELRAFSSHPGTDKRIRRLEAKWSKIKDKTPFGHRPKSQ